MKSIALLLGFLIMFLAFSVAHAQETIYFTGIKAHYGFIIPHSAELKAVSRSSPFGLQFEVNRMRTSDKAWKTCNCYGKTGISLAYFNYQNKDVLGSSYNINYLVEPYLTYTHKLNLSLRGQMGVNYLNKVFDAEKNPENTFFSAKISFLLSLGLGLNYVLDEKWSINLISNFNHISNGGQKQPNRGMNFPTLSLGIDRVFNLQQLERKPPELRVYSKKLNYFVGSMFSVRSVSQRTGTDILPLVGVFGGVLKPISGINGLNTGIELWHDEAIAKNSREQLLDQSGFHSSITFGHHFKFGNVYILKQFGAYITRPETFQTNWLYQRYSLWYQCSNHLTISGSMIVYGHVADHMDGRLIFLF